MSLKLVNLVFKSGSLLALTPAKIEKKRLLFPARAYTVLWILLFSTGISVSAVFRKADYDRLTTVQLIMQLVSDIILFILNISTVVITATKKRQWNKLIEILKTFNNNNEKEERFWFSSFLLTLVALLIILSYETWLWTSILGVEFFKLYAVEYFQFYSQFIVHFLIYAFLKLILDRVQNMYKTISLLKVQSYRRNNFILKKIKSEFCALAECVKIFNDIFGWLMLLSIGFAIIEQLESLQILILRSQQTIAIFIYDLMIFTWQMIGTFVNVFLCDLIEQEVRKIELEALQITANCVEEKEIEEMKSLVNIIDRCFPHFTAARFLDINRKTILGSLSAVISFVIVTIQCENLNFS
ncbi:uncharacterized protein LOC103313534 [Tribolium castaneum]|uniref:Gustatory receptor n=1 Tax=Tribolium castaneum TaxID=7070 RepID=D6WQW6_TRICA|nr:PREDICTED: uncharacterized protein LOC103313534 [Tribolium castaneum]EFA07600.1 gustatory receptor 58 [Tribolium castaneum]|eukprot:XP_008195240.1 PREDICTED: uncharacterized protein LOC103313534 [Tribolium castaneum]